MGLLLRGPRHQADRKLSIVRQYNAHSMIMKIQHYFVAAEDLMLMKINALAVLCSLTDSA